MHETFAQALASAIALLPGAAEAPWWELVEVYEDRLGPPPEHGHNLVAMGPADAYEPRWIEVLRASARNWVNLRLSDVSAGTLRVVVEFFEGPPLERRERMPRVVLGGDARIID